MAGFRLSWHVGASEVDRHKPTTLLLLRVAMFSSSSSVRLASCRKLEQAVGFACRASKRRKFSTRVISPPVNVATARKSNQPNVADSTQHLGFFRRHALGGSFRRRSRLLHQAIPVEHRAFIALGSNLGDRVAMIETACKEMDRTGKVKVLRTSSLWETKAMYVLDQDKFVNGVCEVRLARTAFSRDGCS